MAHEDYASGGDAADSVREMYRNEQDEPVDTSSWRYSVELNFAEYVALSSAIRDSIRWYEEHMPPGYKRTADLKALAEKLLRLAAG